nr:protease IV [Salmonella sp. NCTC 7297]
MTPSPPAQTVEKALTKQFGWSKTENNYRAISYYDYSLKKPADSGGTIAVIFANGAIMDGEETPGNVGGDTTASQIRDARLDPKVKAIVLRVNSPGGSVKRLRSYSRRIGGGQKRPVNR